MNFLITALFVLMIISFSFNLLLRLMRGKFGYMPQIESIKGKFRAYTKAVSTFTMFLSTILLFVIFPFSMITLTLSIISIFSYAASSIIAWKQYLLKDEDLLLRQRIIASVIGNSAIIILWFWIMPLISES